MPTYVFNITMEPDGEGRKEDGFTLHLPLRPPRQEVVSGVSDLPKLLSTSDNILDQEIDFKGDALEEASEVVPFSKTWDSEFSPNILDTTVSIQNTMVPSQSTQDDRMVGSDEIIKKINTETTCNAAHVLPSKISISSVDLVSLGASTICENIKGSERPSFVDYFKLPPKNNSTPVCSTPVLTKSKIKFPALPETQEWHRLSDSSFRSNLNCSLSPVQHPYIDIEKKIGRVKRIGKGFFGPHATKYQHAQRPHVNKTYFSFSDVPQKSNCETGFVDPVQQNVSRTGTNSRIDEPQGLKFVKPLDVSVTVTKPSNIFSEKEYKKSDNVTKSDDRNIQIIDEPLYQEVSNADVDGKIVDVLPVMKRTDTDLEEDYDCADILSENKARFPVYDKEYNVNETKQDNIENCNSNQTISTGVVRPHHSQAQNYVHEDLQGEEMNCVAFGERTDHSENISRFSVAYTSTGAWEREGLNDEQIQEIGDSILQESTLSTLSVPIEDVCSPLKTKLALLAFGKPSSSETQLGLIDVGNICLEYTSSTIDEDDKEGGSMQCPNSVEDPSEEVSSNPPAKFSMTKGKYNVSPKIKKIGTEENDLELMTDSILIDVTEDSLEKRGPGNDNSGEQVLKEMYREVHPFHPNLSGIEIELGLSSTTENGICKEEVVSRKGLDWKENTLEKMLPRYPVTESENNQLHQHDDLPEIQKVVTPAGYDLQVMMDSILSDIPEESLEKVESKESDTDGKELLKERNKINFSETELELGYNSCTETPLFMGNKFSCNLTNADHSTDAGTYCRRKDSMVEAPSLYIDGMDGPTITFEQEKDSMNCEQPVTTTMNTTPVVASEEVGTEIVSEDILSDLDPSSHTEFLTKDSDNVLPLNKNVSESVELIGSDDSSHRTEKLEQGHILTAVVETSNKVLVGEERGVVSEVGGVKLDCKAGVGEVVLEVVDAMLDTDSRIETERDHNEINPPLLQSRDLSLDAKQFQYSLSRIDLKEDEGEGKSGVSTCSQCNGVQFGSLEKQVIDMEGGQCQSHLEESNNDSKLKKDEKSQTQDFKDWQRENKSLQERKLAVMLEGQEEGIEEAILTENHPENMAKILKEGQDEGRKVVVLAEECLENMDTVLVEGHEEDRKVVLAENVCSRINSSLLQSRALSLDAKQFQRDLSKGAVKEDEEEGNYGVSFYEQCDVNQLGSVGKQVVNVEVSPSQYHLKENSDNNKLNKVEKTQTEDFKDWQGDSRSVQERKLEVVVEDQEEGRKEAVLVGDHLENMTEVLEEGLKDDRKEVVMAENHPRNMAKVLVEGEEEVREAIIVDHPENITANLVVSRTPCEEHNQSSREVEARQALHYTQESHQKFENSIQNIEDDNLKNTFRDEAYLNKTWTNSRPALVKVPPCKNEVEKYVDEEKMNSSIRDHVIITSVREMVSSILKSDEISCEETSSQYVEQSIATPRVIKEESFYEGVGESDGSVGSATSEAKIQWNTACKTNDDSERQDGILASKLLFCMSQTLQDEQHRWFLIALEEKLCPYGQDIEIDFETFRNALLSVQAQDEVASACSLEVWHSKDQKENETKYCPKLESCNEEEEGDKAVREASWHDRVAHPFKMDETPRTPGFVTHRRSTLLPGLKNSDPFQAVAAALFVGHRTGGIAKCTEGHGGGGKGDDVITMSRPPSPIMAPMPSVSAVVDKFNNNITDSTNRRQPLSSEGKHLTSVTQLVDRTPTDFADLEDRAVTIHLDHHELTEEVMELEYSNRRLHGEKAKLEAQLNQAEDNNSSLQEQYHQLHHELNCVYSQLTDAKLLEVEFREVRAQLEKEQDDSQGLRQRLQLMETQCSSLTSQLQDLAEELCKAHAEIEAVLDREVDLKTQIEVHQAEMTDLAAQLTAAHTQIAAKDQVVVNMEEVITELRELNQSLSEAKRNLEDQVQKFKDDLSLSRIHDDQADISDRSISIFPVVQELSRNIAVQGRSSNLFSSPLKLLETMGRLTPCVETPPSIHSEICSAGFPDYSLPFCEKNVENTIETSSTSFGETSDNLLNNCGGPGNTVQSPKSEESEKRLTSFDTEHGSSNHRMLSVLQKFHTVWQQMKNSGKKSRNIILTGKVLNELDKMMKEWELQQSDEWSQEHLQEPEERNQVDDYMTMDQEWDTMADNLQTWGTHLSPTSHVASQEETGSSKSSRVSKLISLFESPTSQSSWLTASSRERYECLSCGEKECSHEIGRSVTSEVSSELSSQSKASCSRTILGIPVNDTHVQTSHIVLKEVACQTLLINTESPLQVLVKTIVEQGIEPLKDQSAQIQSHEEIERIPTQCYSLASTENMYSASEGSSYQKTQTNTQSIGIQTDVSAQYEEGKDIDIVALEYGFDLDTMEVEELIEEERKANVRHLRQEMSYCSKVIQDLMQQTALDTAETRQRTLWVRRLKWLVLDVVADIRRWTSAVQNDWLASSSPSAQDAKSNLAQQQQQQQLPTLRGHHQFHQHMHHQFHLEGNELHHLYSSRLDVGHSLKSGEDESELVNDQNSSHDKLLGDLRSHSFHRQSRDESDDGLDFDNISTELERELLALKVHVARSHALLLQYQSKSLGGSKSEMSTHSAPAPSTDVLAVCGVKNPVVSSSAAGGRISRDFSTVPDEGRDSSSLHSLLHCPSCGHNTLLPSQTSVGSITAAAVTASAATISPTTATTTTFPISLGVATTTIATQTSPASSVLDLTQAEDDTTARTLTESESRSKEFLNTTIEEEIEPDDSKGDEGEEHKERKRNDDEEDQYQVDEITIKLDNLNLANSLEALNITSHQLPSVKLTGTVSSSCLGSSKNNFMTTTDLDMAVSGDHNLYTPKPSFDHLEQYRPVSGRRGLGEEKVRRSGLATVAPKRGGGSDSDDDDDDELGCEGSPHQGTTSSSSSSSARGAAAGGPSRLLRRRHTAPPPHTLTTSSSSPAEDNTPPDGEDKEYVTEASFPSSASHLHSLLQRPLLPSLPAIDDDETHSESGSPSPPASPSGPRSLSPSSQKSGTVEGEENETSRERALGLDLSSNEGSDAKLTTSSTPPLDAVDTSLPKAEVRPRSLSSITVFPSLDENLLPGSLFTNAVLSAENLSPQDIEGKFGQLSLAFKTDRLTLRQRMDVQQRERDTADVNFESEVQQLRESTLALQTACVEPELREAVAKVKKNIDVLSNTAERLVSSSEVWGAVQQEWRVSKALEVLFLHVENVKRHHERDHHELEETKKLLNEYQIPLPSASPTSSISSLSAANLDSPSTARRLRALSLAAPIKQESRRSSVTRPALGAGGRRASLFANARPFKEMALVAAAAAAAACGSGQQSEKEDSDRTHGNGSVWGSSIQEEGSETGKDLSDDETSRTPTPPGGHEGQNGVANGSNCVYGSEDDEDCQEDAQDDSESQEERRPSTSAIPRSKLRSRPMEWRLPRIPTPIRDHWLVEGFGEIVEWLRGGTWPYTSQQTVLGARYAVSSLFLVIAILFVILTLSRGDTMQNSCHPGWNWPFFLHQIHPFVSVYCSSPPF